MGFLSAGGKRQREVRFREELKKGKKKDRQGRRGSPAQREEAERRRLVISWGDGLKDGLWARSPGTRDDGVRSIRRRAREREGKEAR